ncbi:MAG: TolC family protein [Myxococcales bacterium]|nr:TolC family protein [Myxococcales bacterium]
MLSPSRSLASSALCAALLLTAPGRSDAGPSAEAVRLDDLIAVAVRQSAGLARIRADRTIARAEADAAGVEDDWITTASIDWNKTVVGTNVEYQPVQLIEDSKVSGAVGVAKKIPTGATLSAQIGLAQMTQQYDLDPLFGVDVTEEHQFVDNSQASAQLKLEQPLVRGFGEAAAAPHRRAQAAAEGANVKAQLAAEELIRDLVVGYWELAYSAQELQVRRKGLELAAAQYATTRDARRAGTVADSALRAVEYQQAVREEALLRAQVEVEARSLELRRLSGLEISRRELVLVPGERFELDAEQHSIEAALDDALTDNPRLQALLAEKRATDVDVAIARDAARPQVNVTLAGTLFGDGPSTGEAVGALGAGGGYELTASLAFQFEIGSGRRGAEVAATQRRSKVVIEAQDLRRMIEVEVVQSVHAVTAARKRAELAEKAIDLAVATVQAEIANFKAARTTNFDVLQRQDELIEAELRRARSIADYHVAVAKLEFLTGVLLGRYGVEVRPGHAPRR